MREWQRHISQGKEGKKTTYTQRKKLREMRMADHALARMRGEEPMEPYRKIFEQRKDAVEETEMSTLKTRCLGSWKGFLKDAKREHDGIKTIPRSVAVLCGATPGDVGKALRSCAINGVGTVCVLGAGRWDREDIKEVFAISDIGKKPHWDIKLVPMPKPASDSLESLKFLGMRLIGLTAEPELSKPIWKANLNYKRTAFVFGSDEEDGQAFPKGVEDLLDVRVTIPGQQRGDDDSLTATDAVSALLYERYRQQVFSAK